MVFFYINTQVALFLIKRKFIYLIINFFHYVHVYYLITSDLLQDVIYFYTYTFTKFFLLNS